MIVADFINTIDVLGDDAVIDSIIQRTITEFKDNAVTTLGRKAFSNCSELTVLELPAVTTIYGYVFEHIGVTDARFPSLTTISNYAFANWKSLENIVLPKLTSVSMFGFYGSGVKKADLPVCSRLNGCAFQVCYSLTHLILRSNSVCTVESSSFDRTPIASGNGYIYVPRALVDSYKAATNWSVYASQFRALEDYTVDGTITGELDETKI